MCFSRFFQESTTRAQIAERGVSSISSAAPEPDGRTKEPFRRGDGASSQRKGKGECIYTFTSSRATNRGPSEMGKVERPRDREERKRERKARARIRGLMLMTRLISNQFRNERAWRARVRPVTGTPGQEREARKGPFKPLYLTSFPGPFQNSKCVSSRPRHVWLKNERAQRRKIGGRCSTSTSSSRACGRDDRPPLGGHLHKQPRAGALTPENDIRRRMMKEAAIGRNGRAFFSVDPSINPR